MLLVMMKLTCQRMAREEQRITAWMSDGSAGSATPDKERIEYFRLFCITRVTNTMLYVLRPGDKCGKIE